MVDKQIKSIENKMRIQELKNEDKFTFQANENRQITQRFDELRIEIARLDDGLAKREDQTKAVEVN